METIVNIEAQSVSNYLMVVSLSSRDRAVANGHNWSVKLPETLALTALTISAVVESCLGTLLMVGSAVCIPFSLRPIKKCLVYTQNAAVTVKIALKNLCYDNIFCKTTDTRSFINLSHTHSLSKTFPLHAIGWHIQPVSASDMHKALACIRLVQHLSKTLARYK